MHNKYKLHIWCLICVVLFSGCSSYNDLYVVNRSKDLYVIKIELEQSVADFEKKNNFNQYLPFLNQALVEIDDKTRGKLSQKLQYKIINSKVIEIELPAESTLCLGGDSNIPLRANSFIIQNLRTKERNEYTMRSLVSHLKRSGGFTAPYHYTYTIK